MKGYFKPRHQSERVCLNMTEDEARALLDETDSVALFDRPTLTRARVQIARALAKKENR